MLGSSGASSAGPRTPSTPFNSANNVRIQKSRFADLGKFLGQPRPHERWCSYGKGNDKARPYSAGPPGVAVI